MRTRNCERAYKTLPCTVLEEEEEDAGRADDFAGTPLFIKNMAEFRVQDKKRLLFCWGV